MPEYTEHERAQLHALARQQIRLVNATTTPEAASNRRFLALGYLLALSDAQAFTPAVDGELEAELKAITHTRIDDLIRETLDGVHCTGHVDYDPDSRTPSTPND